MPFDFVAKNVPILAKTQVLVIGSGTAGIAAAIAAARTGADTMIVERYGCLGGALSVGMVQSYSFSVNQFPQTLSGIPKELEERCREWGAFSPDYRGSGIFVESELYKCMLDEWLQENRVRILLHTTVIGAYVEDGVLKGVYCQSKSGIGIILADRTVDASGDGDVAALAGVPFEKRDPKESQPATVVFGLSNVDMERFEPHFNNPKNGGFAPVFTRAAEAGEWNSPKRGGAWKSVTPCGDIQSLNLTLIPAIDATDAWDLTRAEIEGRKQVMHIIRIFRKYGADIGLGDCKLRTIAPQLGIRETRRIVGEYRLTEQDVRKQRCFEDSIGRLICRIDLYGNKQSSYKPSVCETFSVPYRALIPKNVENLLVSGRCISCDEISFGAVRLMVGCALTGQAAGTAAALSVQQAVTPRQLNVLDLRDQLRREGVTV